MSQLTITARNLIRRSLMLVGAIGQGENPSDLEANDALQTLNELVDKWNTENLMISYNSNILVPMVAGKSMYTIGATGADIIAQRPINGVDSAYLQVNNISLPIDIITNDQYSGLTLKNTPSPYCSYIYYNANYPNGELYVYPVASTGILYLNVSGQFTIFPTLDTIVDLPAGYLTALRFGLAVNLSMEYGREASQQLIEQAIGAKNTIKITNSSQKLRLMSTDSALMSNGPFNIYTGD